MCIYVCICIHVYLYACMHMYLSFYLSVELVAGSCSVLVIGSSSG